MSGSNYSTLPYHKRIQRRWSIAAFFMIGALFVGVIAGQFFLDKSGWDVLIERGEISSQLADAQSIITRLERQIAVYENASRVDQLAVKNTQEDLQALQIKLLEMEKEVEFYRRIISPEHRKYELQIQSFRMFQGQQGQQGQQFALTLSQGIGRNATIQATAYIQFTGRLNGEEKDLSLKEVDREGRKKLTFSFRYFQTVTMRVNYPEDFELETVTVTAEPHTKRREEISRTWSVEELKIQPALSGSPMGESEKLN